MDNDTIASTTVPPTFTNKIPSLLLFHTYHSTPSFPSSGPVLVAHHSRNDGRILVIARASGDQVCLLDGNFQVLHTLEFWGAYIRSAPSDDVASVSAKGYVIRCLQIREGTEDRQVLIFAAISAHIVVWTASNVSSASTKRWRPHSTLHLPAAITSLDFHSGRLLVATGSALELWLLQEGRLWKKTWQVSSPGPIRRCSFNGSGTTFAACSEQDRRVIVWQIKKGLDAKPVRTAVLPHPSYLDQLVWRGLPDFASQSETLITRALDGSARVWAPVIDEPAALRLSATVDATSFERRTIRSCKALEPVFYLDAAVMAAVLRSNIMLIERDIQMAELGLSGSTGLSAGQDFDVMKTRHKRLQHMLSDTPDIFMRFHDDGTIVLRALSGIDRRPPTLLQAYTVLKLADPLLPLKPQELGNVTLVPLSVAPDQDSEAPLAVLCLQSRDGTKSLTADFNPALFFDGRGGGLVKRELAFQTAHSGMVRSMLRTPGGHVLLVDGEGRTTQWGNLAHGVSHASERSRLNIMERSKRFETKSHHRLMAGNDQGLLVWDTGEQALLWHYDDSVDSLQLLGLSRGETPLFGSLTRKVGGILVVTSSGKTHEWQLKSSYSSPELETGVQDLSNCGEITSAFGAAYSEGSAKLSFATMTAGGGLCFFSRTSAKHRWSQLGSLQRVPRQDITIEAASSNGLVAVGGGSSPQKTGTGRSSSLQIFDFATSDFESALHFSHIEHDTEGGNQIVSLDWLEASNSAAMLLVARQNRIEIWTEDRMRPMSNREASRWAVIVSYDLTRISSRPCTTARWLPNGSLLVSTGYQVHILGPRLWTDKGRQSAIHLAEVAHEHNGPLPPYHPLVIFQLLQQDNEELAFAVVKELAKAVEETATEDTVDTYRIHAAFVTFFGKRSRPVAHRMQKAHESLFKGDVDGTGSREPPLSPEAVERLCANLKTARLYRCTAEEVKQLCILAKCMAKIAQQSQTVDSNGLRYLIAMWMRFEEASMGAAGDVVPEEMPTSAAAVTAAALLNGSGKDVSVQPSDTFQLQSRHLVWALHSTNQEAIIACIRSAHNDKLPWSTARSVRVFTFLPPSSQSPLLQEMAEQVARDQYALTRDPVSCSLFYYALGKKKLVLGLWRQAAWHSEQKKMLQFLTKDFEEKRWKSAACKNAFALMSQRRFEFAASFFMLGDALQDAVNVCIKNLNDIDLAIALVRIKEGRDDGPIFVTLLKTRILPLAFEKQDRWLAHWAFWTLGQHDMAVKVLCTSLDAIRGNVLSHLSPSIFGEETLQPAPYEDVSLAVLYSQMSKRDISLAHHSRFALYVARKLRRMGCHIIAAELLAKWDFVPYVKPPIGNSGEEMRKTTKPTAAAAIVSDDDAGVNGSPYVGSTPQEAVTRQVAEAEPVSNGTTGEDIEDVKPTDLKSDPAASPAANDSSSVAEGATDPEPKAEEVKQTKNIKKPGGGVANLINSTVANANQQGAQEFDFGNFGF